MKREPDIQLLPKLEECVDFVEFLRSGSEEPASGNSVCYCGTLDNFVTTKIRRFEVPIYNSDTAWRFGVSHDCILIYFTCTNCNAENIPLTIESGPIEPYVQHWGKYDKYENSLNEFDEEIKYSELERILNKLKAGANYSLLTRNCKDFAKILFTHLFNYNPDRLKYVANFLVYVPNGWSLTSPEIAAQLVKHVILLPYRHFVYWRWYKNKQIPSVEIDESEVAEFFEEQIRAGATNVELKSNMELTILQYSNLDKKFVCGGPVDLDCAQTNPAYIFFMIFRIHLALHDSRNEREVAGGLYNDGKFGTFKFLDLMLQFLTFLSFKFYMGFLLLFGYNVPEGLTRLSNGYITMRNVYLFLASLYIHYWNNKCELSEHLETNLNHLRVYVFPRDS